MIEIPLPCDKCVFVYGLYDPRNSELRYIGVCVDPKRRINAHMYRLSGDSPKVCWLRELRGSGLRPDLRIVEAVSKDQWQERERFWIEHFRAAGVRLTNTTPGGLGGPTSLGKKRTEETRRRLSASLKGHAISAKTAAVLHHHGFKKGQTPHNRINLNDDHSREFYVNHRMPAGQVAKVLGASERSVLRRLRELGLTRTLSEAKRGVSFKLTTNDVREIRGLLAEGVSQRKIAARFGVNCAGISRINTGKEWSWVK